MQTDKIMRFFLGGVAVLLAALILKSLIHSPLDAQAELSFPNTDKVLDARLVKTIRVTEDIENVIPLGSFESNAASTFAIQTEKQVMVYHCTFYQSNR